MSGLGVTYVLCQREAYPAWKYQLFCNLYQYTNIYVMLPKAAFGGLFSVINKYIKSRF